MPRLKNPPKTHHEYAFHNVTITVSARTGKEAYDVLCRAAGSRKSIGFSTDTFTRDDKPSEDHNTVELWPDEDGECGYKD